MHPIRAAAPVIPEFEPVPRRERSDGWTPARQRAFIAMLAATGSVAVACDSVGLHISGAYALRAAEGAAGFVRAWSEALDTGVAALKTVAFDRAVNGVPMTLFYKGELAATTTRYDNRLLMSLLRNYDRPGTAAAAAAPGPGDPSPDTATIMWHCGLELIGRRSASHHLNTFLLKFLLKVQRDPACLAEEIGTATYMVQRASADIALQLKRVNEGPAGYREAAAGVMHKLKPIQLGSQERERAETVMAHLAGKGPPLTITLLPMPTAAP